MARRAAGAGRQRNVARTTVSGPQYRGEAVVPGPCDKWDVMNEDVVLDLTELAAAVGPESAAKFVARVLHTLQGIVAELQELSADRSGAGMSPLADHCHRLKSSTRAVGAMKLAQALIELDDAARTGDQITARRLGAELPAMVRELEAAVAEQLPQPPDDPG